MEQKEQGVKKMGYGERGSGGGGGGGFRGGFDRGPREMHKVTCSDCGKETEVPFKPAEGRPVYCRDCFQNHKPPRRNDY
jgi:CxxC-x17-CxxC domain-containing protein